MLCFLVPPATVSIDTNSQHHVLSSSDFPALSSSVTGETLFTSDLSLEDLQAQEKAQRKAEKRAAAAEKAAERQRIAQEKSAIKAARKAALAEQKAAEKEKVAALKAKEDQARAEQDAADKARAKAAREKERIVRAEREVLDKDRAAQIEKEQAARIAAREANIAKANKRAEAATAPKTPTRYNTAPLSPTSPEPVAQVPLLSKRPKKNKPITKPIRVPIKDEEHVTEDNSTLFSASASDTPILPSGKNTTSNSSNTSRAQSLDRDGPTSIGELMEELDVLNPYMNLANHPFFNLQKINPAAKMPLEYGPLVHALSALSVGGGTFTNTVPSGSIDNAVSSFQQLLETLTQTISDLLRLLPRTTWDDSSSFDGVLRDMLKGDDFLDDGGEDNQSKDDEVAALTLALERRARWMEVQLSKLEELHRDINTAAVRAVLAFNDSGWDRHGFLPHIGNTLRRFDAIGMVESEDGTIRPMSADELEKKLAVAKEASVFAETELREMMENMQAIRPE